MNWQDRTRTGFIDPLNVDLDDKTYLMPCFSSLDLLEQSIGRLGIVNAPLVQEREGASVVPILGRRRLAVARKLGIGRTEVRFAPSDMSEHEGFALAFWDNVAHRRLDAACLAVVVRRLLELFTRDALAREFLPALGIRQHGPRLDRLAAIGGLEHPALEAMAEGRILEKTAWILSKLEPVERAGLLELNESLCLNANKAAEVIETLFDLSIFHKKPIMEFLLQEDAALLLADREMSVPQRASKFRDMIRAWKFPELIAREREFRNKLGNVSISDRVLVRPTAGFESPECTLEIRCSNVEQAVATVSRLGQELQQENVGAIQNNS